MILKRLRAADEGQALIEFALVLPVLLIMIVGIIEFGRAWNLHQVLTDAAREGARKAAISNASITQDSVINTVKTALSLGKANYNHATITTPGWDGLQGTPVTVNVSLPYRFTFFGALIGWATGARTITLRTSFTMRNE
jgi:Flp pilus assembly protein TadG